MLNRNEIIHNILQQHYDKLIQNGFEVVGVWLYGSQNYLLDYEGSDIDTKAIVLPKFNDFVLNKQPYSKTWQMEGKNQCDVKDIRSMFECFKKQNINFIEILFSDYRIINPEYIELFQPMLDNAEAIAHYNNYAAINCMVGMALEKYKALDHPYPSIKEKVEKYGYCNKQFHHVLRLKEFIVRYVNGEEYKDCLISKQRNYLTKVKANYIYSLEEAKQISQETIDFMVEFKKEYMKNNDVVINKEVENIMNKVLIDILKHNFRKEIL